MRAFDGGAVRLVDVVALRTGRGALEVSFASMFRGGAILRFGTLALIVGSAALLVGSCGNNGGSTEGATMSADDEPWWIDIYEEAQRKARIRTEELMRSSTVYPRPPRDPSIIARSEGGRITLVDTSSGNRLITQSTDRERRLGDFRFATASGDLICIFMTQFGGGQHMEWDVFPIRVYNVEVIGRSRTNKESLPECLTFQRFAEFLAAFPDFAKDPALKYVVIDAPVEAGEQL